MIKSILIVLFLIITLSYFDSTTCNNKGSIAEQLNYAGHNCETSKPNKR